MRKGKGKVHKAKALEPRERNIVRLMAILRQSLGGKEAPAAKA